MTRTRSPRRSAARAAGDRPARLEIGEELTMSTAAEQAGRLLADLAQLDPAPQTGAEVTLDLSAVPELDTAGLQILLLLRREIVARGWRPVLTASEPVTQVLAVAGLSPQTWHEVTA